MVVDARVAGARGRERRWRQCFRAGSTRNSPRAAHAESDGTRSSVRHRRRIRSGLWDTAGSATVRWQSLFEDCDITRRAELTEIRHPFLDLRLLQYMLALPAMPWCRNKLIIRRAMRTALPGDVLRRKKSAVRVSPDFERAAAVGFPRLAPSPNLLRYVNPGKDSLRGANARSRCAPRCGRSA